MSQKLQILYFSAPWCAPCRAFKPAFNEVVADYKDDIDVVHIDIDENQDAAIEHNVTSIPTILLIKGDTVHREKGIMSKVYFKDLIEKYK